MLGREHIIHKVGHQAGRGSHSSTRKQMAVREERDWGQERDWGEERDRGQERDREGLTQLHQETDGSEGGEGV